MLRDRSSLFLLLPKDNLLSLLSYSGIVVMGAVFFLAVEWQYGHKEGFLLLHLLGRTRYWDLFFGVITNLGDGLLLSGIGLWMILRSNYREIWLWSLIGALVVGISVQLLKWGFFSEVSRPLKVVSPVYPVGEFLTERSFPSGHSAIAAYWGAWMAQIHSKHWMRGGWFLLPLFIGWSRIYVGAHFPVDVGCGLLLGLVIGLGFLIIAVKHTMTLFKHERFYVLFLFLCKFVVIIRLIYLITISLLQ